MSRGGDLNKNMQLLREALISIKYPNECHEEEWKAGHPTEFLKFIHFALFHASVSVCEHLF